MIGIAGAAAWKLVAGTAAIVAAGTVVAWSPHGERFAANAFDESIVVVRNESDGSLHGFGGGLAMKQALLEVEGALPRTLI